MIFVILIPDEEKFPQESEKKKLIMFYFLAVGRYNKNEKLSLTPGSGVVDERLCLLPP